MSPRWDYLCKECGYVDTNVTFSNWREAIDHPVHCPRVIIHGEEWEACGKRMERVPSAANFTVKGYNAKTGYGSKS